VHSPLAHPGDSLGWIAELAEPYLRGYTPALYRSGSLRGYVFLNPFFAPAHKTHPVKNGRASETALGFFVGYLVGREKFAFLMPQPPECLVFAFVHPLEGRWHSHLVNAPASKLRRTFEYIRWLTHRPPRFEFHAHGAASLVRHLSMREWPPEKYQHYSRNFFIESLAWLVRSGLVKDLLAVRPAAMPAPASRSKVALAVLK
jgi:hypothetical protein